MLYNIKLCLKLSYVLYIYELLSRDIIQIYYI